jgi:hypothetical protein
MRAPASSQAIMDREGKQRSTCKVWLDECNHSAVTTEKQ